MWFQLDNVAKIFPTTSDMPDTRVFRFYCELEEDVSPELLNIALQKAIKKFPNFMCLLKKGFFWYYLEECTLTPVAREEFKSVCPKIYDIYKQKLLFEVTYFKKRINLEIFHVLSDGVGAVSFLKTILYYYFKEKYKENLSETDFSLDNEASFSEKESDGYQKYYQKDIKIKKQKAKKAYTLNFRRNQNNSIEVIEGIVPLKQVLTLAHSYNVSLTVFLTALLIDSIHKEMSLFNEFKPVVLNIPVNLRPYFPSKTTRNFFTIIETSYDFKNSSGEFEDILKEVDKSFKEKLTKNHLLERLNQYAELERNLFIRLLPVFFKDFVLKMARIVNDKYETAVISNIGKIETPPEFEPYINHFGVFASTKKIQLCLCSYKNKLQIGFSSAFEKTDIQKNFFRNLTQKDIDVEIYSNNFYGKEAENAIL